MVGSKAGARPVNESLTIDRSPRGRASAVIPARLGFEDVACRFGTVDALRGVSFTVDEGEVLALLGPSGCGKSTLLRIAAGIEQPTQGQVLLDGVVIASAQTSVPPDRRGIGLVFQDYALFPHFTVAENVSFGLGHLAKPDAHAAALSALRRVGLEGMARHHPHMLSGGEQQRVALARAIVPRPRVLLMDEPFSNLDRRMRDAVREDTVALLRETGATAIVVTHDPEEAMRIADRILLMRDGRAIQHGTAAELYRRPVDLGAARFFCELTEIEGKVRAGVVDTALGRFPAPSIEDGPATVCFRPQAFRLRPAGFCLPGRLVSSRFIGEMHYLELAIQGIDGLVRARVRGEPRAAVGSDIGIDIDADEVLVFSMPRS